MDSVKLIYMMPQCPEVKNLLKDSAHLIRIPKKHKLDEGDLLVSFDVESLFTNIPVEETLTRLDRNYQLDKAHLKLARLCLGSIYFTLDGKMYAQSLTHCHQYIYGIF